jgi:exosortase/archaeosortase family protein
MSPRVKEGALLAVLLLAGWWAAGTTTVAALEQVGAAVAAGLCLMRWWRRPPGAQGIADAAALMLAAVGLALGWAWPAAAAFAWVLGRGETAGLPRWRIAAMAAMSVPWLASDATALGWGFRWTGAWAAGGIFDLSGLAVTRAGTALQIEDQPIAVDAACAGLDTLQATLVAGLWLADSLRTARGWLWAVAPLPLLAWLANTARIVLLGAVAVTAGHEAAKGWFHAWGGLAVVVMVFIAAGAWASWLRSRERVRT